MCEGCQYSVVSVCECVRGVSVVWSVCENVSIVWCVSVRV